MGRLEGTRAFESSSTLHLPPPCRLQGHDGDGGKGGGGGDAGGLGAGAGLGGGEGGVGGEGGGGGDAGCAGAGACGGFEVGYVESDFRLSTWANRSTFGSTGV